MKKSEIINTLKLFCSKDDPRLQEPFCENGNTYATDLRVFVCYEGIEASDRKSPIKIASTFSVENIKSAKAAAEILPELPECRKIEEIIVERTKCNECRGQGKVEWEYKDHVDEFDCPVCDGEGAVVTKINKGKLVDDLKMPILLDTRWFRYGYLALIKTLPGLKILPYWSGIESKSMLLFGWQYGWGALMPTRMYGSEGDGCQPLLVKKNKQAIGAAKGGKE